VYESIFGNVLNVVYMTKCRCTLILLLLATLALMAKSLSGYKRKDGDNEAGSRKDNEARSSREKA